MAVVIKSRISLDVNSDEKSGAENITADGSQFELNLEQEISIPDDSFNSIVKVEEATVWNTVNNVSAADINNHIFITDDGVTLDVTIQDGNYSTTSLSAAIDREYVILGGTSGLVSLGEDFATQRVVVQVDGTLAGPGGAQVDWTVARTNTFRDLIGIDPSVGPGFGLVPAVATNVLEQQLADNVAAFNVIEYFLIHWDGGEGFRVNNKFQQTIARVNITVPPGSQIVSQPNNPAESEAARWIGAPRNHLTFWLTDQNSKRVSTGEIWSARLVFEYERLVVPPQPLTHDALRVEVVGADDRRQSGVKRQRRRF